MFSGHRGSVLCLSFSPDGRLLASAGEDRRVRVWDLAASALLRELRGHQSAVHALAWSPDSALLSSGAADGTLRHWDVKKGAAAATPAKSETPLGGGGNCSPEMSACHQTGCSTILDLRYSEHNTLMVTGVAAGEGRSSKPGSDAAASSSSSAAVNGDLSKPSSSGGGAAL